MIRVLQLANVAYWLNVGVLLLSFLRLGVHSPRVGGIQWQAGPNRSRRGHEWSRTVLPWMFPRGYFYRRNGLDLLSSVLAGCDTCTPQSGLGWVGLPLLRTVLIVLVLILVSVTTLLHLLSLVLLLLLLRRGFAALTRMTWRC